MVQDQTAVCRECGEAFVFSAADQASLAAQGRPVVAPIRCAACRDRRMMEDAALYKAAKDDPSKAYAYRCSKCRRRVLLLRRWKRAIGLLYCPECKPALYQNMPYDAQLNSNA